MKTQLDLFPNTFKPIADHVATLIRATMTRVATIYGRSDWGPFTYGLEEKIPDEIQESINTALESREFVSPVSIWCATDPKDGTRVSVFIIGCKSGGWYGLEVGAPDETAARQLLRRLAEPVVVPWSYKSRDGRIGFFLATLCTMLAATIAILIGGEGDLMPDQFWIVVAAVTMLIAFAGFFILLPKRHWESRARRVESALKMLAA
jgi:hypothetical protein